MFSQSGMGGGKKTQEANEQDAQNVTQLFQETTTDGNVYLIIVLYAAQEWMMNRMDDLISRQVAINLIKEYERDSTAPLDYVKIIEEVPFVDVQPVRNWIPVSKDLPKTPIRVQVQLDNSWIITAYYDEGEWYDVPGDGEPIDGVLAWMPLPEPYKGW